jgi:protein O-GlcNAc transferase
MLATARTHHQAGDLAQAEQIYRQILAAEPKQADAWNLLGVLAHQLGRNDVALEYIGQAIHLEPLRADIHANLGEILRVLGRLPEAEAHYRRALQLDPNYVGAYSNLGAILQSTGRLDEALASVERALQLQPNFAPAYNIRGVIRQNQGQFAAAADAFRQAAALSPDYAEAHNNLGSALERLGNTPAAIDSFVHAIQLNPHSVETQLNLAAALKSLGRMEEAVACLRNVMQLRPDLVEIRLDLGNTLIHLGRFAEAAVEYQQVLRDRPDFAAAYNNLGIAQQKQGLLEPAVANYSRAIELQPQYADAYINLGAALESLGRNDESLVQCERAAQLDPNSAAAHYNRANALHALHRLDEALVSYRRAIELDPHYALAYLNQGNSFKDSGRLDEAAASYRQALAVDANCSDAMTNLGLSFHLQGRMTEALSCYRQSLQLNPSDHGTHGNLVLALNYDPTIDARTLLTEHLRWAEMHARPWGDAPPVLQFDNDRDPNRQLRIGYVSPDLRNHPVPSFFEPVLRNHDPKQVEIFVYAEVGSPDATTARLRALIPNWRSTCGLSDDQMTELVRRDRIDILVDLAGHTGHNRLTVFARHPAPVQVTWLGYPNTTGVASIDYWLTDSICDPEDEPPLAAEKIVRLPDSLGCFLPASNAPAVVPLPARETGHLTFGSLHTLAKLNSQVLDLWSRILRELPDARLLMYRDTLGGSARDYFLEQFATRGIEASRLDLRHKLSPGQRHLSLYDEIDISLDAFPWCGHTTACESMWQGVSMITLLGNRHAGRMVASVLSQVGLTDWIASDPDAYFRLAIDWAARLDDLSHLRSTLRQRMADSPLCNAPRFTRALENAYRHMWQTWASG